MTIGTNPDDEVHALVVAAATLTHASAEHILEDFGEFIVPDLMGVYQSLIKPEWKTKEMLLHTEETIHRVVRLKNPGAKPPRLHLKATGLNSLKFTYNSPRQMSAVAKGIVKGVAKHYRENVTV